VGGSFGFTSVPRHAAGATAIREGTGMSVQLRGGLEAIPAHIPFLRGSARVFGARAITWPLGASVWSEINYRGLSPDLPPQEFEGVDADPSHEWIAGWPGLEGTMHLRGWDRSRAATHVLHANLEMRLGILPDLGLRGPGFRIGAGTLAPFIEGAQPWGGASAGFTEERTRVTFGLEARLASRIGPLPLVPVVAWGRPFGAADPNGSWSWRITTSVPIAMPFRPPQTLGAVLGGGLHQDSWNAPPL